MPTLVRLRIASVRQASANRLEGYYDDVISSSVRSDGASVWITGEDYARIASTYRLGGAGTELKSVLGWLGISGDAKCQCNKRARYMDRMGCEWCEQNLDTIVGWLKEEHQRRKMLVPFSAMAARQVVKLAIRRAKRGNSQ